MAGENTGNIPDPSAEQLKNIQLRALAWTAYFFEFLSSYITKVKIIKVSAASLKSVKDLLCNPEAIFCAFTTLFGVYCLLFGIWSKRVSVFTVTFYIVYSITKHFSNFVDPVAARICNFCTSYLPESVNALFGDAKELKIGYIVISLVLSAILTYFLIWTKLMAMTAMTACIYEVLKSHSILGELSITNTSVLTYILVGVSICFFAVLAYCIEDLIVRISICFIGSFIIFSCVFGVFEFPPTFFTYVNDAKDCKALKEIANDLNFVYITLLAMISMLVQTRLYLK